MTQNVPSTPRWPHGQPRPGLAMSQVWRDDLEWALRRCSQADRELVLGWYDQEARWRRSLESDAIRKHQRYRDFEIIVRDQRNHIANLEAQLMPYLRAEPEGVQEALA